jgi:integrase/recombinase XerD
MNQGANSMNDLLFIHSHDLISIDANTIGLMDALVNPAMLSFYRERIEEKEREDASVFPSLSDGEVLYLFLNQKRHIDEDKNRSETTKREYARDLLQFYKQLAENEGFMRKDVKGYIEGSFFKNVRKRHLRRYQEYLTTIQRPNGKTGYAVSTRSRKITVLKSFFTWLYEQGYIKEAIHTGLLSNEVREQDRPDRDLSYEEVKALLDYYQHHPINYPLLSVLATTGLRVQEIANAKWQDVYYDAYQGRYYVKVIGKRGKERHAILFHNVFERIGQFRKRRRLSAQLNPLDDSPLFTTNSNRPYDFRYLSRYITSIIERTKLPFLKYKQSRITPHFFRHFFAIYSLKQGVNVAYIQQTLGHADIRTTQIYLDKTLKKENDAAISWDENRF